MIGLVVSALSGLLATIVLVTVSWPKGASRFMVGVVGFSTLSFLAWAAIAIFAAASSSVPHTREDGQGESD